MSELPTRWLKRGHTCFVLRANCANYVEGVREDCRSKSSDAATRKRPGRAAAAGVCAAAAHARVVHVKLNASIAHPQEHRRQTAATLQISFHVSITSQTIETKQAFHTPALPQRPHSFLPAATASSHQCTRAINRRRLAPWQPVR